MKTGREPTFRSFRFSIRERELQKEKCLREDGVGKGSNKKHTANIEREKERKKKTYHIEREKGDCNGGKRKEDDNFLRGKGIGVKEKKRVIVE